MNMLYPMPIFIPSGGGHGGGDISKTSAIVLFTILGLVTLFMLFAISDAIIFSKTKPIAKIFKGGRDCDYIIPEGYGLLRNESNGRFVVYEKDYMTHYLDIGHLTERSEFTIFGLETQFDDSCRAKYSLKKFIQQTTFK